MQMLENLLKEMKEVHTSKLTSAALLFLHNTNAPNQIKLLTVFWEKPNEKKHNFKVFMILWASNPPQTVSCSNGSVKMCLLGCLLCNRFPHPLV